MSFLFLFKDYSMVTFFPFRIVLLFSFFFPLSFLLIV